MKRRAGYSGLLVVLLLLTARVQAGYECQVRPQDDVIIKPQMVQVTGTSGNLTITPQGEVTYNGRPAQVDAVARRQAINYQAALRKTLPWLDRGITQRLESGRNALDKVAVEKLGANSNVRNRLKTLHSQLKQQLNRIIEHRGDDLVFHYQAIDPARADGERLVQRALGGVLQDGLNEMGTRQAGQSDNPLQAVMGNLAGLQQAVQEEWRHQEQDFRTFGQEVCNRVTTLEENRKALLKSLQ